LRAPRLYPALAALALALLGLLAPVSLAQPGAGSTFDYEVTVKLHVSGTMTGAPSYNGTITCKGRIHVVVSEVSGGTIKFTANSSRMNCTSQGSLGPFTTLPQSLEQGGQGMELVSNKTLPVDQGFDPDNPTIYVNPDKLPPNGEFKNDTLHLVYDKKTGMLRYAEMRNTISFAPSGTIEMSLTMEMVSSNVKGGHSLATVAAVAAVVVVAAAGAVVALRVLRGPSGPAPAA